MEGSICERRLLDELVSFVHLASRGSLYKTGTNNSREPLATIGKISGKKKNRKILNRPSLPTFIHKQANDSRYTLLIFYHG